MPKNTQSYDEAVTEHLNKIIKLSAESQLIPEDLVDFIDLIEEYPEDHNNQFAIIPSVLYRILKGVPLNIQHECLKTLSVRMRESINLNDNTEIARKIGFMLWLQDMTSTHPTVRAFFEVMTWLLTEVSDISDAVLKYVFLNLITTQKFTITEVRAEKLYEYLTKCFHLSRNIEDLPIERAYPTLRNAKPINTRLPLCIGILCQLAAFDEKVLGAFKPGIYKQLADDLRDIDLSEHGLRAICTEIGVRNITNLSLLKSSCIIFCLLKANTLTDKNQELQRILTILTHLAKFKSNENELASLFIIFKDKLKADNLSDLILNFLHQYLMLTVKDTSKASLQRHLTTLPNELIDYIGVISLSAPLSHCSPLLYEFLFSNFSKNCIENFKSLREIRKKYHYEISHADMRGLDLIINENKTKNIHYTITEIYSDLESKFPFITRHIDKNFLHIVSSILKNIDKMRIDSLIVNLRKMETRTSTSLISYFLEIFSDIKHDQIGFCIGVAYCINRNFILSEDINESFYQEFISTDENEILTTENIKRNGLVFCLLVSGLASILISKKENTFESVAWKTLLMKTQFGPHFKTESHVIRTIYTICEESTQIDFRLLCIRHLLVLAEKYDDQYFAMESYDALDGILTQIHLTNQTHHTQYQFIADFLQLDIDPTSHVTPIYLQIITLLNLVDLNDKYPEKKVKLLLQLWDRLMALINLHPDVSQVRFPARYDRWFASKSIFDRMVDVYYLTHPPLDMGTVQNLSLEHSTFFFKLSRHHTEWNTDRPQLQPYIKRMNFPDYVIYIFLLRAVKSKNEMHWKAIETLIDDHSFVMPRILPFYFRQYNDVNKLKLLTVFKSFALFLSPTFINLRSDLTVQLLIQLHDHPELSKLPCFNELHNKIKNNKKLMEFLAKCDEDTVAAYIRIQLYTILIKSSRTGTYTLTWNPLDDITHLKKSGGDLRSYIFHDYSNLKKLQDELTKSFKFTTTAGNDNKKSSKNKSPSKAEQTYKTQLTAEYLENNIKQPSLAHKIAPEIQTEKIKTEAQKNIEREQQCLDQIINDLKQITFGGEFRIQGIEAEIDYSSCRQQGKLELIVDGSIYIVEPEFVESQAHSRLFRIFNHRISLDGLKVKFTLNRLQEIAELHNLNQLQESLGNYIVKTYSEKVSDSQKNTINLKQLNHATANHPDQTSTLTQQDKITVLVVFLRNILGRNSESTLFSKNNITPIINPKRFGFKFSVAGMSLISFDNLRMHISIVDLMKYLQQLINDQLNANLIRIYEDGRYICILAENSFIDIIKDDQKLIDSLMMSIFNFVLKMNEQKPLSNEEERLNNAMLVTQFLMKRFSDCIVTDESITFKTDSSNEVASDEFVSQALMSGFQLRAIEHGYILDLTQIIQPDFDKFFDLFPTDSDNETEQSNPALHPNTNLNVQDNAELLEEMRKHTRELIGLMKTEKPSSPDILYNLKRLFVLLQLAHRTKSITDWRNKFIHYPDRELEHIDKHLEFVTQLINLNFFDVILSQSLAAIVTKFISIQQPLKQYSLYKYLDNRFSEGKKESIATNAILTHYEKIISSALQSANQLLFSSATMKPEGTYYNIFYYFCFAGSYIKYLKNLNANHYSQFKETQSLDRIKYHRDRMFHSVTVSLNSPRRHIENALVNFVKTPTKNTK